MTIFFLLLFCCIEKNNNITGLTVTVCNFQSSGHVVRSRHQIQDGLWQTEWGVSSQKRDCSAEACSRNLFSAGAFLDAAKQLNKGRLESKLVLTTAPELRAGLPQTSSNCPHSQHVGMAKSLLWVPPDVSKPYLLFWVWEQLAGQETETE